MMDKEFYRRISGYLSRRIVTGRRIPQDEWIIRDLIFILMGNSGMTAEEIRRQALEECDVFIPDEYFAEEKEDD